MLLLRIICEVKIMNILKKPVVACLISLLLIGLSTGYMFLFQPEEANAQDEPVVNREESYFQGHSFLGVWIWENAEGHEIEFLEDGTGMWVGMADHFAWQATNDREAYLYVNDVQRWSASIENDELILSSLVAPVTYHFHPLIEDGLQGEAGIFGDLQEGIVEEIRTQIAEKAANYDGDIIIVSNANAAVAPSLSTFIPTPTIIYNTLGSENGFMGTYMVVEGEVIEWLTFENLTQLILSNADGEIQLLIGEPLVNNPLSFYQGALPVGTNVRIYFNYSGFSLVFDRAAGIAIGFVVLEGLSETASVETEQSQGVQYLALGETFIFDDLEITIEDDMRFAEARRARSSRDGDTAVYFPIRVTNIGNRRHILSTLNTNYFDPSGERGVCSCAYFPDTSILRERDIEPGETRDAFIHLLLTEDGEYTLEFGQSISSRTNPGEIEFRFVFDVVAPR